MKSQTALKFFVSGSRLDAEIDVLSDLRFPCRTVLLGLPFFVFSATLGTRNDDGKIVFLAKVVFGTRGGCAR